MLKRLIRHLCMMPERHDTLLQHQQDRTEQKRALGKVHTTQNREFGMGIPVTPIVTNEASRNLQNLHGNSNLEEMNGCAV